jgi:hypothetical protein
MHTRSASVVVLLCALLLAAGRCPAQDADWLTGIKERFEPTQPTVALDYHINYRFLFLTIKHLANATICATEGQWTYKNGRTTNATMVSFAFDTLENVKDRRKGRFSVHRNVIAILTMPDLDTLLYVKQAYEYVRPLFAAPKELHFREVYDFQGSTLNFRREDYLEDTVQTNLIGSFELAKQGEEIATMLELMADVYYGRRSMITEDEDVQISANINGIGTPFDVTTRRQHAPMETFSIATNAVRLDIVPAPEAKGRGKDVALWGVGFTDLATRSDNAEMRQLGRTAPQWNMVPLVGDYGLSLGYVRGILQDVRITDF